MVQSDCRVCLADGAWNIFSADAINDERCTAASINDIPEKLQYVTGLQPHEDDGLPLRICELCIIQLNVAYRFKRLATESDHRLQHCLEASDLFPSVQNALTNEGEPMVPEIVMMKLEESTDEISLEPSKVTEEHIDSYTLSNKSIESNGPAMAMIHLQKDFINPAEDIAYLKEILKKEVISMSGPKVNEDTTDQQSSPTSTTIPPEQSKEQRKRAKTSKKRKRSESETRQHGSDNPPNLQNGKKGQTKTKQKLPKQKDIQSAVSTTQSKPKSSSSGSTKQKTKPTKKALRKQRLQKVLNSLRIDMMYNNTVEWHTLKELQSTPDGKNLTANMPLKRRNSVCVSSFAPWL